MGYHNLRQCTGDLATTGQMIRIDQPIDAHLEAAEIHRRVNAVGGPAIFFSQVVGCRFPMVSNLFGTIERARFLFRDTLEKIDRLVQLKIDPTQAMRHPLHYAGAIRSANHTRPKKVRGGPVLANTTTIDQLPQMKSWPEDGGPFITLPIVYTEDPSRPGLKHSNLGMYRVQLSGGEYVQNEQIGLHYQIHRGIGVHHQAALQRGDPFRVNIFVGGSPAMMLAAVMPLPEGMTELSFAGVLEGQRIGMISTGHSLPIYAQADFCISGTVEPNKLLPEGPFGDHLGYYSLQHDFPVLHIDRVYHRDGAIWPFTVVGRPPQEDSMFGQLIHEITGPIIPTELPGVSAIHAVDAAGVHPLLLAIGSERYTPYSNDQRPAELLTQANAILGQGQLSLAKYLLIVNRHDNPQLDIHRVDDFLGHLLARVDWCRDLHFQTCTTIDTLDYSSEVLNEGSKVVIAAVGSARRELPGNVPSDLRSPSGFVHPKLVRPGVLVIEGPAILKETTNTSLRQFCDFYCERDAICQCPLVVLVDDSALSSESLDNFLWVTFTRSNPAADIDGIGAFVEEKHWGCRGSLVIDARCKPHHAPPLEADPEVARRVEQLATSGGPLSGII